MGGLLSRVVASPGTKGPPIYFLPPSFALPPKHLFLLVPPPSVPLLPPTARAQRPREPPPSASPPRAPASAAAVDVRHPGPGPVPPRLRRPGLHSALTPSSSPPPAASTARRRAATLSAARHRAASSASLSRAAALAFPALCECGRRHFLFSFKILCLCNSILY